MVGGVVHEYMVGGVVHDYMVGGVVHNYMVGEPLIFYTCARRGKAIKLILVHKALVVRRNLTCFQAFQPVESLKLAMEIIMKWTEGRSNGTMINRTILAMSFSIHQHCCAQSSLLVSAIYNVNLHRRFVFIRMEHLRPSARKIRLIPHNYPWVPARNNHGIPQKS